MNFWKRFTIFFLLSLTLQGWSANTLNDPLENAKKIAIGANKLILVDFYADWCGPCKRMDSESWNKQVIKEIASNYIFVKIDIDRYRDIAVRYGIKGIPFIFILDPNGEVVHKNMGYLDNPSLAKLLKKYSLNLNYLQTAYIINFKKESVNSYFRLAQKQQEYAILLDKSIRNNFLILSQNYLDKAEKILKKDKNDYYVQKLELLKLHGNLINGNYKKIKKRLESPTFDEQNIDEKNKPLYCFLNYMVYNENQEKEVAEKWISTLKKLKYNKVFLKEIELLASKS